MYIDAEPDLVFDYFTVPDALVRWMGDRAILDPRPGGRFALFFGETLVEGRYVRLDRPHSLVITWGRAGSPDFPPHASTLEVVLAREGRGTRVRIEHSGLPERERRAHAGGWRYYLPRLTTVALGVDPGPQTIPPGPDDL